MRYFIIIAVFIAISINSYAQEATYTTKDQKNFEEKKVYFKNDTITFGATLTIPKDGKAPFPAVVLVTGSGQQDRDEDIFGFKVFKVLAEHLSNNGIAVLRYDDRGVGETKASPNECTTEDFAGDAWAAYQYLASRSEVDPNFIGILGHSEGGTIAMQLAAKHKEINFIVLMAAAAVKGSDIVNSQIIFMNKSVGRSDEYVEKIINLQNNIYEAILTDGNMKEVKKQMVELILEEIERLPEDQKKMIKNPKEYAEYQAEMQLQGVKTNWFKYFISYDPRVDLVNISCPVLALFAELDTQVLPTINKEPLENALAKAPTDDITVKTVINANHLFQRAVTGQVSEYASLEKRFVDGFPELISSWIIERYKK